MDLSLRTYPDLKLVNLRDNKLDFYTKAANFNVMFNNNFSCVTYVVRKFSKLLKPKLNYNSKKTLNFNRKPYK